jgi:hypothetical protein
MTTGRVFAATPEPASQISPGRRFIQNLHNILFHRTRAQQIEGILVRQSDNLCHAFPNFCRCLGLPFAEPGVQHLEECIHVGRTRPPFYAGSGQSVTLAPWGEAFI